MALLKKIRSFFGSFETARNYWFYVKCDVCKEVLQGRVDLQNDLSLVYGEDNQPSYYCRKVLIGSSRCYRPIEVELNFDTNRKLIDRNISGGEFVSEDIYRNYNDKK